MPAFAGMTVSWILPPRPAVTAFFRMRLYFEGAGRGFFQLAQAVGYGRAGFAFFLLGFALGGLQDALTDVILPLLDNACQPQWGIGFPRLESIPYKSSPPVDRSLCFP